MASEPAADPSAPDSPVLAEAAAKTEEAGASAAAGVDPADGTPGDAAAAPAVPPPPLCRACRRRGLATCETEEGVRVFESWFSPSLVEGQRPQELNPVNLRLKGFGEALGPLPRISKQELRDHAERDRQDDDEAKALVADLERKVRVASIKEPQILEQLEQLAAKAAAVL